MSEVLLLGGYGGHTGQALGIAKYLREKGIEFDVLTLEGTERRYADSGARRIMTTKQFLEPTTGKFLPLSIPKILIDTLKLGKYKVVIANGSVFALPPTFLLKLRGSKIINVETIDAVVEPSRAPKIIHRYADVTFVQWPELKRHYPNALVSGPIFEPLKYEPEEGDYILVTAGTKGYKDLFDAVVRQFDKEEIVLQVGKMPIDRYKDKAKVVFSFSYDFHKWLAKAKAVITTFPSSTAAIASLGFRKPTVIVPHYGHRAVPMSNMEPFAKKTGCVIANLNELKEAVEKAIRSRASMPKYEHGGKKVAEKVLELLEES
ncbi:hypothetical protein IPA_04340 [Ignicoccus pacificus DSM 13166]|uniref:Glycosyl transferase family 28 C-terminal domain-containing protein n=1 Tax=Ignicoccus pacificus DSM 13166 TaxID=940294 RepID=A0A977KB33_9CREN|nr:hypothetical protein IPA_04340 [Ignicoccus pacificus DSM 13166]